jgi:Cation efflux family
MTLGVQAVEEPMLFRDLRDLPGLPHGLRWGICLYLLDGPLSIEEISAKYETDPIPTLGRVDSPLSLPHRKDRLKNLRSQLPGDLAILVGTGWLVLNDDRYALTQKGREQAILGLQSALSVMSGISSRVRAVAQPSTASKLTILVQILLAAIKLPAGLLSGSVGLLNDSLDTILDLLSGFFVYLGVRFNRERLASTLLVVCMTGTGSFSLYEAVRRFFVPQTPRVQWFPIFAAGLSAIAGIVLWQYQ